MIFSSRAGSSAGGKFHRRSIALAVGTATAVTAAIVTVSAAPAFASNGEVYLSSASGQNLYVPTSVAEGVAMAVDKGPLGNSTWTVTDKGSWTANGITGEGEEFAQYGTDLCIGDTTAPGGGYSTPTLQPCGANGTVWVACRSGGGDFLYNRYFLNQGGGSENIDQLGVALNSSHVLRMVNEDYASAAWYIRWGFPVPGPTPPAC